MTTTTLDLLLVKPGSQKQLYGDLSGFHLTAIEPPFWGALLAGYLRQQGFAVDLLDAEVEGWSYAETAQQIRDRNPLLLGIVVSGTNPSASTMNMIGAGQILREVKQLAPDMRTMLTGLHPSALPGQTMREEVADFVIQGEGFFTLPALLRELRQATSGFTIPGLWYRDDDTIKSNEIPPVFPQLDDLPMPAWDLLPMAKYRAHNWHCFGDLDRRQPYGVIYTSLGCPFRCNFCCIHALFGQQKIRYRSPQKVVEEIDFQVKTWGVRNFKIMDEMFAMNEARIIELCDLIIARKYDLNFWAYARVNTVTERMLARMKAAGINWVAYGFESGSERVLRDATKGYHLDALSRVLDWTKKEGLYICANFIFGLPEDDFDSMHETLKLMLDINAEWANIYCAMAYPGSKLYEQALEMKWPLPATWDAYSQYSPDSRPLPTRHLSGTEVQAFRDYAFRAYFQNPRYLTMIARTFGTPTARHIMEMAAIPLPRQNSFISGFSRPKDDAWRTSPPTP